MHYLEVIFFFKAIFLKKKTHKIINSGDIMAASKTGSGKTLSYLVPVIERLYLNKWTVLDGLGALIILPTRELAIQVFQVFNSITEFCELSVGLIIGSIILYI